MKRHLPALLLFAGLLSAALPASAQVYVQVAPPAPVVETIPASPGTGYVWVNGHYRWDGNRYVWVGGRYSRHAGRYCDGHWRNTAHGYVWVEGHWC